MNRKPFIVALAELIAGYWPRINLGQRRWLRWLLPTPGNVIFTLLVVAGLLWASNAGALPLGIPAAANTSTGTIAYQGRLADSAGSPLTGTYNMIFRLYDAASGDVPLWTEQWTGSNGVQVSDGLFNVMLGSLTQIPQDVVTGHDTLWLGITVGTDDEMTPRVQLGTVPFAVQALTVPDGSVTTEKITDGAVTTAKLNVDNSLQVNGALSLFANPDAGVTKPTLNFGVGWQSISVQPNEAGGGHVTFFNTGGGNPDGAFVFRKEDWSDNPYIMKIETPSGNVGIGTMSPSERLHVMGNILATGSKSAVVDTAHYGPRKLYASESPEVRFFDEGLAKLEGGVTRVTLDPVFLETIEDEYLVHVTPYGDASLYVAEIGTDYFVVKARDGDSDVAFAWRLSAHRKGYGDVRLEATQEPDSEGAE